MDMEKLIIFLANWIISSIVLLVISAIFAKSVVLGSLNLGGPMVAVLATLLFTLALGYAPIVASRLELKFKNQHFWILFYTIMITPIIWILKSFSIFTGFGVSNNLFVIVIAVCISIAYYFSAKYSKELLAKILSFD